MKKSLCFAIVGFVVFVCLSATAGAAPITVPNAGFELRKTFDPFPECKDDYNQWAKEYWRHFEVDNNGGPLRIWNPGVTGVDETSQGVLDVAFGGNAPEGDYVVVVRSRYNDDEDDPPKITDFEAAVQLLDATFDPTMTYKLTAKVGKLPHGAAEGGSVNYTPSWYGYAVQLAVGGTNVDGASYAGRVEGGTVIAQDDNSLTVPVDGFVTATVMYTPDPANAGLAGQPLQIRLCALEDPLDHSLTGWVVFDDVTLDAREYDPTEPSVDAGEDMITWSGEPVTLDPNVVNNDVTDLTYLWSADPDDGVVFESNSIEEPNVTITKPALTLTAVTIVNQGFEDPVLADGGCTSTSTPPPAWINGYYDVADPAVWVAGYSEAGGYNPSAAQGYGGVVPEGENVAYATSYVGYDKGMSQVLSATLQANTQYDLSALVGNPFLFNDSTAAGNYRIELLAGGVVLDLDTGPSPADDTTWTTASLTYNSGADAVADPNVGQPLEIRLLAVDFTDGKGVDFDDVKLTAEGPIPDPYIVKLTLKVNNVGKPPEKVREDTMTIDVYGDACLAAIAKGLAGDNPGDFDENCITDPNDLDELAAKWLTDISLTGPVLK